MKGYNMEEFYTGEKKLEVAINGERYNMWNVELKERKGIPDCMVGHFGKNFYFRTDKGMKGERYETFEEMINAIKEEAKKNGLIVTGYQVADEYKEV